jgi:hypothetical protein
MQDSGVAKNVEIFRRFSSGTLCSRFSVRADLENVQLAFQACLVRRLLMRRRDSYSKNIIFPISRSTQCGLEPFSRSLRISVRGTFSLGKRSFQALTGIQRSLLQLSNNQLPNREAGVRVCLDTSYRVRMGSAGEPCLTEDPSILGCCQVQLG